jgi:hypothetical protein
MAMHESDQNRTEKPGPSKVVGRNILRIVISLLLIAAGIGGARFLISCKDGAPGPHKDLAAGKLYLEDTCHGHGHTGP